MRCSDTIETDGQTVTVSELTVGEIRAWFKEMTVQDDEFDLVRHELFDDADLDAVGRMTDIRDLDEWTPSQLEPVIEACRRVNPRFFALRDRLQTAGRKILEARAAI
ncbi:MAG: hypothetical protein HQL73_06560 [Magnetococcales bacterium]|nr:hypothetical protein [Magnetococcales bacterium]